MVYVEGRGRGLGLGLRHLHGHVLLAARRGDGVDVDGVDVALLAAD